MTDSRLTVERIIQASDCDSSARLGVVETFSMFMDLAGLHAEQLGNGLFSMRDRGLFWAAVKTRVRFFRRPAMMELVTAETWPEPPGRLRQVRDYLIRSPRGEVLAAGKTEWTILDQERGGLYPVREGIYPSALEYSAAQVLPEPFYRFTERFDAPPFARYTVRSTDIDMGRHMNNVAYVRMLAGLFSTEVREHNPIRELEIHYRSACYEGDVLSLCQKDTGDRSLALRAAAGEDDRTVVLARAQFDHALAESSTEDILAPSRI